MGACCAFGCSNRTFSQKRRPGKNARIGVSFHRFPKDLKLRSAWLRALRRKNFVAGPDSRVCSDHFSEDSYVVPMFGYGKKCLSKDAVPSIFPAFPAHMQKKVKTRKPPKVREFIPPKGRIISTNDEAQDPKNLFVAHRNSSATACSNLVNAKPTFKLPLSEDFSHSVLEVSSEGDQNFEEPLEPDFNPADYIFPVDAEGILESATPSPTCAATNSPVVLISPPLAKVISPSSAEVLTFSPSMKASLDSSTLKRSDSLQNASLVVSSPIRDFAATNLNEFASSEPCKNCYLYKEANMLLGNELEGREQTISYLQEEIIRLKKQLEAVSSKKISVRIVTK